MQGGLDKLLQQRAKWATAAKAARQAEAKKAQKSLGVLDRILQGIMPAECSKPTGIRGASAQHPSQRPISTSAAAGSSGGSRLPSNKSMAAAAGQRQQPPQQRQQPPNRHVLPETPPTSSAEAPHRPVSGMQPLANPPSPLPAKAAAAPQPGMLALPMQPAGSASSNSPAGGLAARPSSGDATKLPAPKGPAPARHGIQAHMVSRLIDGLKSIRYSIAPVVWHQALPAC
jgi:hypothetical protein